MRTALRKYIAEAWQDGPIYRPGSECATRHACMSRLLKPIPPAQATPKYRTNLAKYQSRVSRKNCVLYVVNATFKGVVALREIPLQVKGISFKGKAIFRYTSTKP